MLEIDKTLILFGRSPFINEIAKYIPDLCNKYHTMGCNYFCDSFPMVEYVIFYDDIVPKVQPHSKIITNIQYYKNEFSECNKLLKERCCELYWIRKEFHIFSTKPNMLHFCVHTPSMALNWAYLKGFKNVILAGIDLTLKSNEHFDKDITPDADTHDFNISALRHARRHLTETAQKYLKIYQLNPESNIDIPKIKISDLL